MARAPRGERLATTLLGADPRVTRTGDGRWALAAGAAASPDLDDCRFAVVDLEATGPSARRGARILEVAVVAVGGGERGGDPRLVYHTLVNPGRPIPPVVGRLTGICDALVRDAPPFERVVDDVLGAVAGAVFVAHNVCFDWSFL